MAGLRLIVRIGRQEAELRRGAEVLKTYKISSAKNGLGCELQSRKTPTGTLRVAVKIGAGCARGTVFRRRLPSGELWSSDPSNPLSRSSEDLILTRILWLAGCEPHNTNTLGRSIYLHGTNQEHLLGTAASNGCIRFSNRDIEEIFELVPEGTLVEIVE